MYPVYYHPCSKIDNGQQGNKMEKLTEGYGLIEGPVWFEHKLFFSDVLGGGVFSLDVNGAVKTVFEHRRGIGGMAVHEAGGLIVSGRNISYKSFAGGETQLILDRNEAFGNVGYNDLTTDSMGRIYVGSLGASPVFADGREPQSGDLYLIDLDGTARKVGEDIMLTNGLAFSPDGTRLYHSDSTRRTVHFYDVGDDGSLGPKQTFATFDLGAPDGLVVSEDGRVWVALAAGGAGVAVLNEKGQQVDHLAIPQPMCTSVCFGGDDRSTLYVVSGSDGMDSDQAGAIYAHSTDTRGCEVTVAKVKLP